MRFQRKFEKWLSKSYRLEPRLWIEFEDKNGRGVCQPDCVLLLDHVALVIEVKLSLWPGQEGQLTELYMPLVSYLEGLPTRGILVYKNPNGQSPKKIYSLAEAKDEVSYWPWRGDKMAMRH